MVNPSGPATVFDSLIVGGVPILGGMGGLPLATGNFFFVDYLNGNDGATGQANDPLKTIAQAYAYMTDGNNDVCVIVGDGGTAATQRLSESLTWAKDACHLIGMTAPVPFFQRARISTLSTQTTNINPLMTISASGCIFANFSFFQGVGQSATDEKLIDITGSRNYFGNVHFGGMGAAAGAARAGSYIMYLNGGSENLFDHCGIGMRSVARSAANASVKIANGAQDNEFRNSRFIMYPTANSPLFLDASGSNALNGSFMVFTECSFQYLDNVSSATQPAVVATVASDVNGVVLFDRCTSMAAKWAAASSNIQIAGYPVADGFDSGAFANAADS